MKKKSVKNTKGTRRKFVLTDTTLFLVLVIPGQNCAAEVFHSGDSDSTAVMAAACFGAMFGFKGVPEKNYKVSTQI